MSDTVQKKASKKSKKVRSRKARRPNCKNDGCRRQQAEGFSFCQKCLEEMDGVERTTKVTEIEALQFAKADGEIRSLAKDIAILDLEKDREKRDHQEKIRRMDEKRMALISEIEARKPLYEQLIERIASKYGISDVRQMSIDTETRVIRDLAKH